MPRQGRGIVLGDTCELHSKGGRIVVTNAKGKLVRPRKAGRSSIRETKDICTVDAVIPVLIRLQVGRRLGG